jgi:hypothetical protein
MNPKTAELLDLWMTYAARKLVAEAEKAGTLVHADEPMWEGKNGLYSPVAMRAALATAIDEGFVRLDLEDGDLAVIWAANPAAGEPETRVYPGREFSTYDA